MTCYHPIRAYKTDHGVTFDANDKSALYPLDLPCGQCLGCRLKRASEWSLRISHEASQHKQNCFVTLTYDRDKLPVRGSLDHRDWQLFFKRLRKHHAPYRVRFYMCGEYGPQTFRPHYHACLFNIDFADKKPHGKSKSGHLYYKSATLENLWQLGHCTVQPLTRETADYCARYIMEKQTGETTKYERTDPATGEIYQLKPEYNCMSRKPGIGWLWFQRYSTDLYPHDFTIHNGKKVAIPRYYDKLADRHQHTDLDQIKENRKLKAAEHADDQTPERLAVRETVHAAKTKSLTRGL